MGLKAFSDGSILSDCGLGGDFAFGFRDWSICISISLSEERVNQPSFCFSERSAVTVDVFEGGLFGMERIFSFPVGLRITGSGLELERRSITSGIVHRASPSGLSC